MATIGSFTAGKDGYAGTIRTLTISVKARIVADDKESDAAPDFRVYAGRAEPVRAALFEDDEGAAGWSGTEGKGKKGSAERLM